MIVNLSQIANDNKILEIKVGSHLYGANTPTSDVDYSGVFLPTKELVFGFQRAEEVDLSIIDKDNEAGRALLAERHKFPHQGLLQKFKSYAFSQKHKMIIRTEKFHELENALNYLKDYTDQKAILVELKNKFLPFMKFNHDYCVIGDLNLQKSIFVKKAVAMIEERLSKVGNRKSLITKYGYDAKFASHLIRLLLEGKELISTGEIIFPLSYRQTILDIKQGKWTIKEVLDYADFLEAENDKAAEKSELPKKPRFEEIEKFTINLL